jgi:hypothetical protein
MVHVFKIAEIAVLTVLQRFMSSDDGPHEGMAQEAAAFEDVRPATSFN